MYINSSNAFPEITLEDAFVLESTLYFKKAPYFGKKEPFCNVKVSGDLTNIAPKAFQQI